MHDSSVDFVENHGLARSPIIKLCVSEAWIDYQTEGEEEGVLCEQIDDENSMDVAVSELIDGQVKNGDCL